jgi:hypothetical protein
VGGARQGDHQTGAPLGLAIALDPAPQGAQPLAHPGEPCPFRRRLPGAAPAVVRYLQADRLADGLDPHLAAGRPGVADDVGDRLAEGEGEGAVLGGGEIGRDRHPVRIDDQGDIGGIERHPRPGELGAEILGPVAGDRAPHLFQRFPRDPFEVGDLAPGGLGIAGEELPRELRLEGDERQGMPEKIVEVAADALPLGHLGEALDLVLRLKEPGMGPPEFLLLPAGDTDEQREQPGGEPDVDRQGGEPAFEREEGEESDQPSESEPGALLLA